MKNKNRFLIVWQVINKSFLIYTNITGVPIYIIHIIFKIFIENNDKSTQNYVRIIT